MTKEQIAQKLREGVACASCTSEQDRVFASDLIHASLGIDDEATWERHEKNVTAFVNRLARRHTCTDFYPVKIADAEATRHFDVSTYNDGTQVSYRIVYRFHDNVLYGPGESTPNKAVEGFKHMTQRIAIGWSA